jgi:hypothetical protein
MSACCPPTPRRLRRRPMRAPDRRRQHWLPTPRGGCEDDRDRAAPDRDPSRAAFELVPRERQPAVGANRDARVVRCTFGRDPFTRRKAPAVGRHRVEERDVRFGRGRRTGDERRPDDVDAVLRIDRHRGPIVRTPLERPLVFAHAQRVGECAATVARHREGHVAKVAGIDVPPGRVNGVAGAHHRGLAAVAHAAGQRARRERSVEGSKEQLRFLRHRHAIGLAGGFVIVVRCRHRWIVRELAVIEPDRIDAAAGRDRDRLPPAIPRGIGAGHQRGGRERLAAVLRARLQQLRSACAFCRPHDYDRGIAARPGDQRDMRRLLAIHARVAFDLVDANRRDKRASAVPAHRRENVGRSACLCGTPGDRDEVAVRGNRGHRVAAPGHTQLGRRRSGRDRYKRRGPEQARNSQRERRHTPRRSHIAHHWKMTKLEAGSSRVRPAFRLPDRLRPREPVERATRGYGRGGGGSGGTVRTIELGEIDGTNSPATKPFTTDVARSTGPVPPASATSIASTGAQALRILHSLLPPPAVL